MSVSVPPHRARLRTAAAALTLSAALAGCAVGTPAAAATNFTAAGAAAPVAPPVPAAVPPTVSTAKVVPVGFPSGTVVMVIRHGEKPAGSQEGFDAQGHADDSSLTRTGWARARHLVGTFGHPQAGLSRPAAIFAAGANEKGEGARTRETVGPLAADLGLAVNTRFGKGEERALVRAAAVRSGPTLIAWSHKHIPAIATAFPNVTPRPPSQWPDSRFDVVWVFTKAGNGWRFTQVPEMAMPQDKATVIGG